MSAPSDVARCFQDIAHCLKFGMQYRPLSGAILSPERPQHRYRFALWRLLNPDAPAPRWLSFIMLNPSTAAHDKNDNTLNSCIRLTKAWGFDGLVIGNLFALSSKNPSDLKGGYDPIGPANDLWIDAVAASGDRVVAAWGANGGLLSRDREVLHRLTRSHDVWCFRKLSHGEPEHPLYMPSSTPGEILAHRVQQAPAA